MRDGVDLQFAGSDTRLDLGRCRWGIGPHFMPYQTRIQSTSICAG
jgi:hypothetical protein